MSIYRQTHKWPFIGALLLTSVCCAARLSDANLLSKVEVYSQTLLSSTPVAISPAAVIEKNRRTRKTIVDQDDLSLIELRLRQIDSTKWAPYQNGADARIVFVLHRGDSNIDTLSFSRVDMVYRGVNYLTDTTLLIIARRYVDVEVQQSIDQALRFIGKQ
jgi:hypothetical protein